MGQLTLFPLFQSGMVIQRNKPISVWGDAPAGSIVTITLNTFCVAATTDEEGHFCVTLPAMKEAEGCGLTVSCNVADVVPVVLKDVAIGDVWLACGQSNMEFFLRYDQNWDTVKHYENNPLIRVYNVPQTAFEGHRRNAAGYGRWMQSDDPDFETFSAPGYSFARTIQPEIGVPVGIIGCNWGGTTATAWLHEENLKEAPLDIYLKEYEEACALYSEEEMMKLSMEGWAFEDSPEHDLEFRPLLYGRDYEWQKKYMKEHQNDPVIPLGPYNINRPGGLYHLMLEPLHRMAMKGVIWYQGESDAGHADIYDVLMTRLIESWRKEWNDEFPFLFVQLAPFGVWLECTSENYKIVRKKQEQVRNTVPNTAMASIMDIGSYYDIHPKEKMEVGRRLALLALGKVYGKDILCDSPCMVEAKKDGDIITIKFDHCENLTVGEGNNDFDAKQNGQKMPIHSINVVGNTIEVTIDNRLDIPVTLSLGYSGFAEIHIYNEAKLPICPFVITV